MQLCRAPQLQGIFRRISCPAYSVAPRISRMPCGINSIRQMRTACVFLAALTSFVAIAGFPWLYWEGARLGMDPGAPAYVAWHFTPQYASAVWWLMGLGMLLWAPCAFLLGLLAAWRILQRNLSGTAKSQRSPELSGDVERLVICPACMVETEAVENCVWCGADLRSVRSNA